MTMSESDRPLRGQVALVTGAGRGLGRAFAEHLARLGCAVGVHGMREQGPAEFAEGTTLSDTAREIGQRFGVATLPVLGDLTRRDHVARVVESVTAKLGPIDVLVHNAGGNISASGGEPRPDSAIAMQEDDVRAVLDRNLLSLIFMCQAVAPGMVARRRGRIVTLGSVAAHVGKADGAIYATAKAAVTEYTRCLAAELRPHNVTANVIAPGSTRTGRWLSKANVAPEMLVESGTLVRVAMVDEVARVVTLFAGPQGDFITGQVLRVDGGGQTWPA
jgi:3-oxoacyl-[acyl-carrier protein] reductase